MKFEVGLDFIKIPPEHFHALLVHFPIALWSCAFVFFLLSFSPRFKNFEFPACLMGLLGSAFGLLALKAGEKAAEVLSADMCAYALLEKHEENGETAFIFFTAAFAILATFMLIRTYVIKRTIPTLIMLFPALGMLLGMTYLVKGGHEGYQLVYQHGVGVTKDPTPCR